MKRSRITRIYGSNTTNKEHDFFKGERVKLYKPNIKLNIPLYLESVTYSFVEKNAEKIIRRYTNYC